MIQAGPGLKISTRVNNGVKETEVEENDQKIKIHDDPKQGISVEITKEEKDGKDVTEKFEAKNAEELKKEAPRGRISCTKSITCRVTPTRCSFGLGRTFAFNSRRADC